MKRNVSLILVIASVLTLLLTGCANTDTPGATSAVPETVLDATLEATQPVLAASEPELESPVKTTAVAVPENTAPEPDAAESDAPETIIAYIPMISGFGDAVLTGGDQIDESTGCLIYGNVSESDLSLFLSICTFSGLYPMDISEENQDPEYMLFRPGCNYSGYILYNVQDKELYFETALDGASMNEASVENMLNYYTQDVAFPASFGKNVLPQFYTCANTMPSFQTTISDASHIFDGARCWTEFYERIPFASVEQYITDMILCGFDIWYDHITMAEDSTVTSCLFHLSNGDLEMILDYSYKDQSVWLYYEPDVNMYLLSGSEYMEYLHRDVN